MHTIGTIRAFHTANFSVVVEAIEDNDVDLSFDETGEVIEQLQSGELQAFAVRARVTFKGHDIAHDYLGGCIYKDFSEFQDHIQCAAETRKLRANGSKAVCGSYFSDMVRNVISEARQEVRKFQSVRVR
mgnify:CR=1 FL=1